MKPLAIIQARMGSSRLPGKILQPIEGRSMLARVIERTLRARAISGAVVATTDLPADDATETECRRLGVGCFRGSEDDVLARYAGAARANPAEAYLRITSDCPLIDPDVIDDLVRAFNSAAPPADYASNKIPQSFPRGLDAEVFTAEALFRAEALARAPYERAHVTVYMYEHPEDFRLLSVRDDVDRAEWRWTVDTPEDLEFVREVYKQLGAGGEFGWRDVLALLERRPELAEINRHIRQKDAREG